MGAGPLRRYGACRIAAGPHGYGSKSCVAGIPGTPHPPSASHARRRHFPTMPGTTQMLQRRIMRADGLLHLMRDQMLGNLAAARRDLEHLARQLDGQTRDQHPSPGGNSAGWPRT